MRVARCECRGRSGLRGARGRCGQAAGETGEAANQSCRRHEEIGQVLPARWRGQLLSPTFCTRNSSLAAVVLLIGAWIPLAAAEVDAAKLRAALEKELKELPAKTAIGLVVSDGGATPLFATNADEPLKPASVLKLFTSAAAVRRLGTGFQFRTEFRRDGEDLLIIGGGDPGLADERLSEKHKHPRFQLFEDLAEALRRANVSEIDKIAIDDGVFDREFRHPDWPADQAADWYQAPIGALNLNNNCIDSIVRRGDSGPTIELIPALPPTFLRNEVKLGAKGRPSVTRAIDSDVLVFRGVVPPVGKNSPRDWQLSPVAVGDPTLFVGHAVKTALAARGIRVRGDVVRRSLTPEKLRATPLLLAHQTTLEDVLWRCNAFSQNMFAECLIKALAAYGPNGQRSGHAGTWERGAYVVRKTLSDAGMSMDGAILRDGSGLSHDNRVSAGQIVALLRSMQGPEWAAFRASLARAGEEGTMRSYKHAPLIGKFIGKTGTIRGVSTLAGYLTRSDGQTLMFAVMVNGERAPDIRQKIVKILADTPSKSAK